MTAHFATVEQACARFGLTSVAIGEGNKTDRTRRRQELWDKLPPAARLCLWAFRGHQPGGVWSLINSVEVKCDVKTLTFGEAITPLIDIGWAIKAPNGREIWLTRSGYNARAALLRVLRK